MVELTTMATMLDVDKHDKHNIITSIVYNIYSLSILHGL